MHCYGKFVNMLLLCTGMYGYILRECAVIVYSAGHTGVYNSMSIK
jgi:hypothetical protein